MGEAKNENLINRLHAAADVINSNENFKRIILRAIEDQKKIREETQVIRNGIDKLIADSGMKP